MILLQRLLLEKRRLLLKVQHIGEVEDRFCFVWTDWRIFCSTDRWKTLLMLEIRFLSKERRFLNMIFFTFVKWKWTFFNEYFFKAIYHAFVVGICWRLGLKSDFNYLEWLHNDDLCPSRDEPSNDVFYILIHDFQSLSNKRKINRYL